MDLPFNSNRNYAAPVDSAAAGAAFQNASKSRLIGEHREPRFEEVDGIKIGPHDDERK